MKTRFFITVLGLLIAVSAGAQFDITINATLKPEAKSINITQQIVFKNNSTIAWHEVYLNDWGNSFSSKTTPLAKRFAENYNSSFHFEKKEDRGKTTVYSITDTTNTPLDWERGEAVDIIKVSPKKPIMPGATFTINLMYTVKLPSSKFTRFGITGNGDYKLRYWYIAPAVFDNGWQAYSNKNTNDLFLTPSSFSIAFEVPKAYRLVSDFNVLSETVSEGKKTIRLQGDNRNQATIYLEKKSSFQTIETDKFTVITNLRDEKISPQISALAVDRIVHFLDRKLGEYPFKKMVISEADYRNSPVYGLNQLPDFISPFPAGFEYDMEQLKTITRKYLETTLPLNPRKDSWLTGALQIHLMMDYVDTYYPKMKILGSLSDFWVIRWAHAADLEFNDQYPLLYQNMARNNLQQALTTSRDSLLKFNKNIANDYYGGAGLKYLSDYLGKETVSKSISEFYSEYKLKPVKPKAFQETLQKNTRLPVNWFFTDYIDTRTTIDFRIKNVEKEGDSLSVTVKNTRKNKMPVSLYGINNDSIVFKKWLLPVDSIATVTVPKKDVRKLVLNYEKTIPEYNQRNNYKAVKGLLNRPLQFRLFQDVGDSRYNQVFFMPEFQYNLYDGFVLGPKVYNKTVLAKGFHYKFTPQIGLRSKTIIGSGSLVYTQNLDKESLYSMRYGFSGSYFSYDRDLFYRRFTPFMTFAFRNKDLRDNEKQFINLRSVNVIRDENPNDPNQDPNYSVFNLQYVYSNPNLINYFKGVMDYEISAKFSKISTTLEYRKLFLNNRQLNLRFFAGAFLFNDTREDEDFFSFALDRPTDYLFDYNYYGRSEQSGLFSQQLIVAEGGFKSQLTPKYANSWITTVNASTNIWKWIYAYGDAGLIHNTDKGTQGVFDTGIRLSLVADYFELYFPLYSNLGWEPGLENYDQRIRFIVTLDLRTLLGLFTRKWY
ncbi:gluzincin family metallopeptidase [Marixanthomonas spongiae]|uniref:Metalloprotease n=1 Tax=Marixanthomonas spongiae TaxID=2174845 RepID=A0A2U0I3U7_9FLAO|nr:metalloprotease [Marixanthomonas spongiae]PVW15787.1 metalloprotease [Marixanthomonas spongiae]